MFSQWKEATLRQRRRRQPSQQQTSEADEQAVDSDEEQAASSPLLEKQTLRKRMVTEKNRVVQRVLVALRLATATTDSYFTTKVKEVDALLLQLDEMEGCIEAYSEALFELCESIRVFAGNSSDTSSLPDAVEVPSFLLAAEKLEDRALELQETIRERVLAPLSVKIAEYLIVQWHLHERCKYQIDVDYANRTLHAAQQRGDVNQIASRKRALQVAKMRLSKTSEQITSTLRRLEAKQDDDDRILNELVRVLKRFFRDGALLLRPPRASPASPPVAAPCPVIYI
ncbi:hypothetical protein Poli38472_000752 [Pythium oligandrum]|uniref:Uncharacterized protein n=1 Tax=Pythium oligandrum TaxID=41045 RepID=A0A8K1CDB9_PYTOL|nr:hypothetical protein Poli38472_000752 [Pythium oligandrum]|eukprot:TMW60710.1 hypothetical protein Poli38472_000752 [Pythium oligandrum]